MAPVIYNKRSKKSILFYSRILTLKIKDFVTLKNLFPVRADGSIFTWYNSLSISTLYTWQGKEFKQSTGSLLSESTLAATSETAIVRKIKNPKE